MHIRFVCFSNDSHIDGEQLARRCGYPTFEAFLDSKDAKKIVEIKIVDGRRHYCAPYDVRTHHIYNEQKKSMAAAAQRLFVFLVYLKLTRSRPPFLLEGGWVASVLKFVWNV